MQQAKLYNYYAIIFAVVSWQHCSRTTSEKLKVAIYDDIGGEGRGPDNIERALQADKMFFTKRIDAGQIIDGVLKDMHVLVMPGGSGSIQARHLSEGGLNVIRDFVGQGGGYLGFCAGAYLATDDYEWSLGLL